MIDIDFIRRKIYKPDENKLKIMPGDEIPIEVINILKDGHYKDREECFGPGDPKTLCTVHLNCTQCNAETTAMLSKTGTLNYLKGSKKVLCDGCARKAQEQTVKEKAEAQALHEAEEKADQDRYDANTNRIINQYVNKTIDGTLSQGELIAIWKDIDNSSFDNDKVATAIKLLPYKTFLQTPYWKAISYQAKRRSRFSCCVCGSRQALSTHHKTYGEHGCEHTYYGMRELIVLCQDCHAKFHDKLATL